MTKILALPSEGITQGTGAATVLSWENSKFRKAYYSHENTGIGYAHEKPPKAEESIAFRWFLIQNFDVIIYLTFMELYAVQIAETKTIARPNPFNSIISHLPIISILFQNKITFLPYF